jgi:Tfp pilus assembly protein FimT
LLLVLVIIGVLAVIGFRSVQPIIISGRVEASATDLNNAVQRIVSAANSSGAGATVSYSGFTTTQLIPFLSSSNVYRTTASTINHRLSTGSAPTVVAASALSNAALQITFAQVHDAACVDLTSLLQTAAVIVSVNGTSVKDSTLATPTVYNGVTAATSCTSGSTNSLVFTFQ